MDILDLYAAQDWHAILNLYDTPDTDIPPDDDPYWLMIGDANYWERGILAIIAAARRAVADSETTSKAH